MTRRGLETKRHNYLLRSTHSVSLIRTLQMIVWGRVVVRGHYPSVINKDNSWAGYCAWEIAQLEKHGLVVREYRWYRLTDAGMAHLDAAEAVTEISRTDTINELDARKVW